VYSFDVEKLQKDKSRCDEILQRAEKVHRDILLKLLMHLFPRLHNIYEPDVNFYHSEMMARKNFRICSPDMFDIYFRLSMSSGQIPDSEMETLLALSSDESGFSQALLRLNQDNRINKFLDLLDSVAVNHIQKKNIGYVINALMNG